MPEVKHQCHVAFRGSDLVKLPEWLGGGEGIVRSLTHVRTYPHDAEIYSVYVLDASGGRHLAWVMAKDLTLVACGVCA